MLFQHCRMSEKEPCSLTKFSLLSQVMILSDGKIKLISRRQLLEDQLMLERNLDSFINT